MTKKLTSRITALISAVLLLGMATAAQVVSQPKNVCNPSGKQVPNVKCSTISNLQQWPQAVVRADEEMCTVSFDFVYDSDVYYKPSQVGLLQPETGFYVTAQDLSWMGMGYEAQVPAGNYDIVGYFTNKTNNSKICYVILEQYEVAGDVTVTLNTENSTNLITTKFYGPDGELLKHGLGHMDNETYEFIHDEDGNIDLTQGQFLPYLKEVKNSIMPFTMMFFGDMTSEEARNTPFEIYVNDVSDRYVFLYNRVSYTEDFSKTYVNWASTADVKAGLLQNDPSAFVHQTYNYKYSPIGAEQIGIGAEDLIWMFDGNNVRYTGFDLSSDLAKPGEVFTKELWTDVPYNEPNLEGMNLLLQSSFQDYGEVQIFDFGDEIFVDYWPTGRAAGPVLRVKDGQKELVNLGHHEKNGSLGMRINYLYGEAQEDMIGFALLPEPEAITHPAEKATGILNDNCPINAVRVQPMSYLRLGVTGEYWATVLEIKDYYVGRYGESLTISNADKGVERALTIDGNEANFEGHEASYGDGVYEYTSVNTNINVDGLDGKNTTVVHFDNSQEDSNPPSIEMLLFKDNDGNVTDRFVEASDGTIEFYASDFLYHPSELPYQNYGSSMMGGTFECAPVDVQVEYAPFGTEEWSALTVEEVPELFNDHGWGYFYRGALADVTEGSLNGWFDLKFRLTDEAGNWQEQVLSPAFRIDQAMTSVTTVNSNSPAKNVRYYNVSGVASDTPFDGVNIVVTEHADGTKTATKVIK
jgi:hypothetical protein